MSRNIQSHELPASVRAANGIAINVPRRNAARGTGRHAKRKAAQLERLTAVFTGQTLTLPYPPSVNGMYATVRGRRVLSAEGREYKQRVAAICVGIKPTIAYVSVTIDVYRQRRAGDLDNVLKALLDSLTGCVWEDDDQVCEIHARRFEDAVNPRVEIKIERMA